MNKPSVILILTDQQRADTMHYLCPDSVCVTPNLDSLAAESLCFDNAYTVAPVCTPARSSLHTGLFPSVTGMCTNIYQQGCITHELADRPFLLSRRMEEAGYRCGFTGKWHLGLGKDKSASSEGQSLLAKMKTGRMSADAYLSYGTLPTDIGFIGDDFPGHGDGGHTTPQFREYLEKKGLTQTVKDYYREYRPGDHSKGGIITSGYETTVDAYLAERTGCILDQIALNGEPFFMMLNYWGPHEPYLVMQEDYDLYRDMTLTPWPSFTESKAVENKLHALVQRPEKEWSFFENNLKHYYAAITGIDRSIGRVIDGLKARNLYDNCYIIFCADHGDSQGCHNGMENKSGHMYQETTRIPLMIKPPKGYRGRVTHALASTVDLYATVLDIAGFGPEFHQSGHSLLPLIEDPGTSVRDCAVCESVGAFPLIGTQRMFRQGKWKYIFNCGGDDELYDLESDPSEMNNLIHKDHETVTELRIALAKEMYAHGDDSAPWFCKINRILDWSPASES